MLQGNGAARHVRVCVGGEVEGEGRRGARLELPPVTPTLRAPHTTPPPLSQPSVTPLHAHLEVGGAYYIIDYRLYYTII